MLTTMIDFYEFDMVTIDWNISEFSISNTHINHASIKITGSHIGRIRSKIKKEIELELNKLDDLIIEIFNQISKTISKRSMDAFLKK